MTNTKFSYCHKMSPVHFQLKFLSPRAPFYIKHSKYSLRWVYQKSSCSSEGTRRPWHWGREESLLCSVSSSALAVRNFLFTLHKYPGKWRILLLAVTSHLLSFFHRARHYIHIPVHFRPESVGRFEALLVIQTDEGKSIAVRLIGEALGKS